MSRLLLPIPAVLLLLWAGCSMPPARHHHEGRGEKTPPALFADLGKYHQAIATSSPPARAYFDQGLRLVYGFSAG